MGHVPMGQVGPHAGQDEGRCCSFGLTDLASAVLLVKPYGNMPLPVLVEVGLWDQAFWLGPMVAAYWPSLKENVHQKAVLFSETLRE